MMIIPSRYCRKNGTCLGVHWCADSERMEFNKNLEITRDSREDQPAYRDIRICVIHICRQL